MSEPNESTPRLDWSEADRRTDEMRARLNAEEPTAIGAGLGMNANTLDSLNDGAGDSLSGTGDEYYVIRDGYAYLLAIDGTLGSRITA